MLNFIDKSYILIVNDIDKTLTQLLSTYPKHSTRVIRNNEKEEFLLIQANEAIKEAYIASSEKKYIFLCGSTFRKEAQNSLLKILEEPPKNIVFIIITNSKSSILPTIYSRIPYKYLKTSNIKNSSNLDLMNLDLKKIYSFLKQNEKISKKEAKDLVETILVEINQKRVKIHEKQLENFSKAIKLLNLNSKPSNVLTFLLLSLINK